LYNTIQNVSNALGASSAAYATSQKIKSETIILREEQYVFANYFMSDLSNVSPKYIRAKNRQGRQLQQVQSEIVHSISRSCLVALIMIKVIKCSLSFSNRRWSHERLMGVFQKNNCWKQLSVYFWNFFNSILRCQACDLFSSLLSPRSETLLHCKLVSELIVKESFPVGMEISARDSVTR